MAQRKDTLSGSATWLAYAAGPFSSAYFGRKLGPKLLLVAGIAVSALCNIAFVAANGFWTVMLFLAINGLPLPHPKRPESVGLPPIDEDEGEGPPVQARPAVGRCPGWTRDKVISAPTMGVICFPIRFLRYALWSWAPFFLRQSFGRAGYLPTVFELCGSFGVIAAGVASNRSFHRRRIAGFMLFCLLSGAGAMDVGSRRGALAAAGIINGTGSMALNRDPNRKEFRNWINKIVLPRAARA